MSKFPCTQCGSTNWPNPNSSCDLCRPECEEEEEEEDHIYKYQTHEGDCTVFSFEARDALNRFTAEQFKEGWMRSDMKHEDVSKLVTEMFRLRDLLLGGKFA